MRLPTASNGVARSDPAHRFGTLPRSHLGRLVDLTAAIVVPDDQRQMSRSGAAERYWRTREGTQLRLWYRPRDRGSVRVLLDPAARLEFGARWVNS